MRIIAGTLGGRAISPQMKKWPTRPTTDRTRESLFNILDNIIIWNECKGLDLFGGTGLISFEMISRGVPAVDYVENYPDAVAFVRKTAREIKVEEQINVIQQDVFTFLTLSKSKYDLIYADPPYQMYRSRELPDLIMENELLAENGILVIEHDASIRYQDHPAFSEMRTYGQTYLSFFENRP